MSLIEKTEYSTNLDVKHYLQTFYCNLHAEWTTRFRVNMMKDFFRRYSSKWDSRTAKLLDFGAGAVIMNYISGAPHVAEIFHAAHTADERREMELWKSGAEEAHDWRPALEFVVGEVEGFGGGEASWRERAASLRSKIRVLGCDIHDEHPIGPTEPRSFSIVCTSFVLESVCSTYENFKFSIAKLVKLLKLGGYLVIIFVEDQTFYTIGQEKWAVLPVSLEQVRKAVEESGCVTLMVERDPSPIHLMENQTVSDQKSCSFIAAYRVRDC